MSRQRLIPILAAAALFPTLASADPGELTAVEIGSQGNTLGYFEYLPAAYDESQEWPLLVFLSGIGENGNGMLPDGEDSCSRGPNYPDGNICRNLRHGPQNLIYRQLELGQAGLWDDTERPFIVVSPQNPAPLYSMTAYDAARLDTFFDYLLDTYAIDERRIYITGMSMGGYSTMLYLQHNPDRLAALSIMPGIAATGEVPVCDLVGQNIWVFHGENDTNPFSPFGPLNFVRQFRACPNPHPYPRATVYAGAGHDVWTRTINPSLGMDDAVLTTYNAGGTVALDPYDIDVYTWLLQHDRPSVSAGSDLQVTTADNPVLVTANTVDDDTITYTWSQIDGPVVALEGADTASLVLRDLAPGTYRFSVLAVDSDGQFDRDEVAVEVTEAPDVTAGDDAAEGDASEGGVSVSAGDASAGDDEGDGSGSGLGSEGSGSDGGNPGDEDDGPGGDDGETTPSDSDSATSGPGEGGEGADTEGADGDTGGQGGDASSAGDGPGTDTDRADEDGSGSEADASGSDGGDATAGTGTGGGSGTGGATGGVGATGTGGATGGTSLDAGEGSDEGSGGTSTDDDGGCNCSTQSPGRGGAASLLGLFGLLGLRRRRYGRR